MWRGVPSGSTAKNRGMFSKTHAQDIHDVKDIRGTHGIHDRQDRQDRQYIQEIHTSLHA